MRSAYRARNLDVANAYGLNKGLVVICERMRKRKDCPLWLIEQLNELIERSNRLIRPLIEHRDEMRTTE